MNRLIIISFILIADACSSGKVQSSNNGNQEKTILAMNSEGKGPEITIDFIRGKLFYYPLFAIWIEESDGKYIQTLYVAKSVATGIFQYAEQKHNKWQADPKRAPQTLPYWAHKRGVKASDGLYMPDSGTAVADAYTGATPVTGFILTTHADNVLPDKYIVMLEINQNWDWNDYWTNDKYHVSPHWSMK
jgi:hypothetical protein